MRDELTRHEFIRRTAGTGLVLSAGSLSAWLSGCGGSGGSSGSGGSPAAGRLTGPQDAVYADLYAKLPRGGRVAIGIAEQIPSTLDVLISPLGATNWAADPAHDFLERFDHRGQLRLSLAEEVVEASPTELRYRLRRGVRFHSGRRVTADDVKKTIEFVGDEGTGSALIDRVRSIKRVKVLDEATFTLQLSAPNADQRGLLSAVPIIPFEDVKAQAQKPAGCGPFEFVRWQRDAFIEFRRFDDYWNPDAPRIDTLRIQHYADGDAAAQAFLAGEIQALMPVAPARTPEFQQRAESGPGDAVTVAQGVVYVGINVERQPWDDPRIRRAVSLAVDREAMATAPFNGISQPLWFIGILPEHPLYPKDLEYPRDLEEARRLLAEAGRPGGFRDRLLTLNLESYQAVATIAKANLEEVGIVVELDVVDEAAFVERAFERRDYTLTVAGFGLDPVISARVDRYVHSKGAVNYFNYSSPKVDRLLTEGVATYEEDQRRTVYHQAFETVFIQDVPLVPVAAETTLAVDDGHTNMEQYRPMPNGRFHFPIVASET